MKKKEMPPPCDKPVLTLQEVNVALGIANGQTYREIGETINLGYETVRAYVDRLRCRTGRMRKPLLAIWAYQQQGWLQRLRETLQLKNGNGHARQRTPCKSRMTQTATTAAVTPRPLLKKKALKMS